ncbi:hypothetical protein [Bradyrhizobium elkanii]|uniref:hypothetical protein n=1 Tax=Bradyrhizobium elkanii TaxID=29448 RepID=UPI00272AD82A|nr:hypothetical protein [Bradyrhizobium elkanii]WLA86875.1 hypothetical protein QNJ99_23230 [Bradyrhizobium elkanii]
MKAITMLRLYTTLATGGFGLCLALDATMNSYATVACIFTTAAMVLMLFGWFDLRSSIATKAHNDILRENINTLIKLNAKRSAEAASFLHALINIRDGLREGMGREGMIEVVEDALAEHHDPATAAQFCIEWLKALGVPPMVSIPVPAEPALDGKAF